MMIHIFSDLICPWCLIGKRRLDQALAERPAMPVEIVWQPFMLNPQMPLEGMERDAYLAAKFGGKERARGIYRRIEETAAADGIEMRFDLIPRTPSTLQGHRLVRFAAHEGRATAATEALFAAYFQEGRDIGDPATLLDIAGEIGLDIDAFATFMDGGAEIEAIMAMDGSARRAGISGVPTFIFERKYALVGAQDPAAFLPIFDALAQEQTVPATA